MSTTFESIIVKEMSYDDKLASISRTILDLLEYAEQSELPPELEAYAIELRAKAKKLSTDTEGHSYAEIDLPPNSPQEAASKMLRVFRTLDRLLVKAGVQAATADPIAAIQLLALNERLSEQAVVIERYVWLGTTRA